MMGQIECSETSACKIQTPWDHPKERIQQTESFCVNVILSVTGLECPKGFQEVKVPRFRDNGTEW